MISNLLQQINSLLSDTNDSYKISDKERVFLEKVRNEVFFYATENIRLRTANGSLQNQLNTLKSKNV